MKNLHQLIRGIRQLSVCFVFFALVIQTATAQNITRIEYFYDTDPGFGSGTPVTFTAAANIPALAFSASITGLSNGFHTLYIRSRDANNRWSLTNNQPFIKFAAQSGSTANGNIVKMEYFVDTIVAIGAGTDVPLTPGLDISNMSFNVSLTGLAFGFHTLYVRTKDINDKWSLTNYGQFIRFAAQSGGPSAANIVKIEYFVDTDPGFGAGTNVPVTAAPDISGQVFSVSLNSLANGFHTLYVRTKDANGKWSLTNYGQFIKFVPQSGSPVANNIVKMEYFVDADPGFGAGTNIPVTAAMDISAQSVNIGISALASGFHTLYIRSKDADGKWSLTNYGSFIKYATQTGTATAGKVIKIEYFIDTDPGFGHGVSLAFTHAADVNGLVSNINLTSLPNGFHTFYIRSMDTLGKWSLTNYSTFTGGSSVVRPTATINTNGSDTFCLGAGTYLYATYQFSTTYQWQLNNAGISGATGINYIPTQTGNYRFIATNSIGSDTSASIHVIVNPVPTATISANGPLSFCQSSAVGLTVNATSGATYQWYNNGSPVGANSTGYSAFQNGVYYVSVSVLGGCSAVSARDTVVVTAAPSAIVTASGSTTFCTGDSVTLAVPSGSGYTYHWSNSGATSSIKVFTQGNYSVTVTNSSSCSASSSQTAVTVVGPPAATITPSGATSFCNGGSVTLAANTGNGLAYLWTGGAVTSSIGVTTTGTYSVTVSNSGCSRVSSPVTVTVTAGPVLNISATAGTVCQGAADTLTATGATTYSWSPSTGLNTSTGTTVIATPASATTYTVTGTTSGCIGTATVTVNINANHTTVSTTTPNICGSGSATLNASGANSYSWSPSGTLNQSTGASVIATPATTATYTVTGTSGTCSSTATVTVNVTATVVPSVVVAATRSTLCAGTIDTFTAVPTNGGASPTYQWYKNGVIQSGSTGTFISSSLSNNDSVWCLMTSNAVCPLPSSATSNKIHVIVNAIVIPTIAVTVSNNPICAGDTVTFTAAITNGGSSPSYVWKKNNQTVGTNASTYTIIAPVNNDSVWCVFTSTATCATPSVLTSNKVKMIVTPITTPTITVTPSQNPICAGVSITFNIAVTGAGSNPAYQWYKNGNTVGTGLDSYSDNALANNDSVWCVLTSNASCVSPHIVTSSKVVISVAAVVTPSVNITTAQTSICAGSTISFTAHPTNGGLAPTYQWYKNGVIQSGNTSTFGPLTVSNNDSVWCIITSNATCPVPTTATSNHLVITVNPVVVPTISISVSQNSVCAGTQVTFTAAITNGGSTPVYQWVKNGVNTGTGLSTYGPVTLSNSDSVWCVFTSNAPCPSPSQVTSNKVHMIVNPVLTPSVSISATQSTICVGTSVTFTATPVNPGTTPTYQWYKNGAVVTGTGATYTNNALADNDSVWCILTSNAVCPSTTTATSNKIVITITTTVVPSVTVTSSQTSVCAGTSVLFTAHPVNGGSTPAYQWYKNGTVQAGNTVTFTGNALNNNDSVWTIMTSNASCVSTPTTTSNRVVITVIPIVVPTVIISASQNPVCAGDSVVFTSTVNNGGLGPVYNWIVNGVSTGNANQAYTAHVPGNNDSVWVSVTSNATCATPPTVLSSKTHLVVNPVVTPTVVITASQNPVCAGTSVVFTAAITNGGNNPGYLWYKNGTLQPGSSNTINAANLVQNDSVWCILTSNAGCVSNQFATSNQVHISITPSVIPSVTINASQSSACLGSPVLFTATPVNDGGAATYRWYSNGALAQSSLAATFNPGMVGVADSVWCIMTSSAACPTPDTAVSNGISVTVLQPSYYSFGQNICPGDSFMFRGNALKQGGTYNDTLSAANGCDSIVTLSLTVYQPIVTPLTAAVCYGDSFVFKGLTLKATGTYSDSLTSTVTGCDSTVVLSLQVLNQITTAYSDQVCQGYTYNFHGQHLGVAGSYADTLTAVGGCDSIVTLTLSLKHGTTVTSVGEICEGFSYPFQGSNLTQGGTYRDTVAGLNGCDSINVLTLTVHAKPTPVVTKLGSDTLVTTAFGAYHWLLNGHPVTGDTTRRIIAVINGAYSVSVIDSFGCSDTSSAVSVTGLGIDETSLINLSIYPNPTDGLLTIKAENVTEPVRIELRDDLGRILFVKEFNNNISIYEQLNISNFSSGMYLVVIRNDSNIYAAKRIFKN